MDKLAKQTATLSKNFEGLLVQDDNAKPCLDMVRIMSLTPETAYEGSQVSFLKNVNEGLLDTTILLLLIDLYDHFKVKRRIENETELMLFAARLKKTFWYLNLEEIALAFEMAKNGQLIKVYDRLDPATIQEVLFAYDEKIKFNVSWNNYLDKKESAGADRNCEGTNIRNVKSVYSNK